MHCRDTQLPIESYHGRCNPLTIRAKINLELLQRPGVSVKSVVLQGCVQHPARIKLIASDSVGKRRPPRRTSPSCRWIASSYGLSKTSHLWRAWIGHGVKKAIAVEWALGPSPTDIRADRAGLKSYQASIGCYSADRLGCLKPSGRA